MGKNISQLEDGEDLGSTDWLTISQQMINEFADATGDHQWIHVDPQRCAEQSPFKKTIAHGLLSTSLMPKVFYKLIQLDAKQQTLLNYGMDSLRFLESVRVDDRIRYHVKLDSTEVKNSGILYRFDCQVEIENREKPAMVGKFLMLLISGE